MVQFNSSPAFLELPFGEQLTLWGMRCWVADKRGGGEVSATLEWAYHLVGACDAADDLSAFLGIVLATAHSPVDVRAPAQPTISDDEHLLLGAAGAAQHGRRDEMLAALSWWLPPAGLRLAEAPLHRYAMALHHRQLSIRRRAANDRAAVIGAGAGTAAEPVRAALAAARTMH